MEINLLWVLVIVVPLFLAAIIYNIKKYGDVYLDLKRKEIQLLAKEKPNNNTEAHERMLLFLERIKPSYLVKQFDANLTPREFVYLIEKSVEQEFEYNISQQLYIEPQVWSRIVNAKNDVIGIAKGTLEKYDVADTLAVFKTNFIMNAMQGDNKIAGAIMALQNEIK